MSKPVFFQYGASLYNINAIQNIEQQGQNYIIYFAYKPKNHLRGERHSIVIDKTQMTELLRAFDVINTKG